MIYVYLKFIYTFLGFLKGDVLNLIIFNPNLIVTSTNLYTCIQI